MTLKGGIFESDERKKDKWFLLDSAWSLSCL